MLPSWGLPVLITTAAVAAYLGLQRALRWRRARRLARLSADEASVEILNEMYQLEMPFIITKAAEFALFRTFGVPTISKLLDSTKGFEPDNVLSRYEDTTLLIQHFAYFDVRSNQHAAAALARFNQIHGFYADRISNDDMLYTLSQFMLEPARFCARFGWRAFTPHEREACFNYWRVLGERMGIRQIPTTVDELDAWNRAYEARAMRYSVTNQRVAEGSVLLFIKPYPRCVQPLLRRVIYALLDDRLTDAIGAPRQPAWLKGLVRGLLRARAALVRRLLLPRRAAVRRVNAAPAHGCTFRARYPPFDYPLVSYPYAKAHPDGYTIDGLGQLPATADELGMPTDPPRFALGPAYECEPGVVGPRSTSSRPMTAKTVASNSSSPLRDWRPTATDAAK